MDNFHPEHMYAVVPGAGLLFAGFLFQKFRAQDDIICGNDMCAQDI